MLRWGVFLLDVLVTIKSSVADKAVLWWKCCELIAPRYGSWIRRAESFLLLLLSRIVHSISNLIPWLSQNVPGQPRKLRTEFTHISSAWEWSSTPRLIIYNRLTGQVDIKDVLVSQLPRAERIIRLLNMGSRGPISTHSADRRWRYASTSDSNRNSQFIDVTGPTGILVTTE